MSEDSSGGDTSPSDRTDPAPEYRILYPIIEPESTTVLQLAAGLAQGTGAELVLGHIDDRAETYSYGTSREAAREVFRTDPDDILDVNVRGRTLTGPSPLEAIVTAVSTYRIDVVIMGSETSERFEAQVDRRTDCDTVVVSSRTRLESLDSILVPLAGGPHSGAATEFARALAEATAARVELIHIVEEGSSTERQETAKRLFESGRSVLSETTTVDTRVVEAVSVGSTIVEASNDHDLTVIGAPRKGRLRRLIFGSTTSEVRDQARNTVVMVRHELNSKNAMFPDSLLG